MPSVITDYSSFLNINPIYLGVGSSRTLTKNYNAWHSNRFTSQTYTEALNKKEYFTFRCSIINDYTKVVSLTSCEGFVFNISQSGPKRLAFGYKNNYGAFNLIADIDIQYQVDQKSGVDYSNLINQSLSSNPIVLDGNFLFRDVFIIPYSASAWQGVFRFYESNKNKNLNNGADIKFKGSITTGPEIIPSSQIPGPTGNTTTTTPSPDPLSPSAVYVLFAGNTAVEGEYNYQYISSSNTFEYYNSSINFFISQLNDNKKWVIISEYDDDYYISSLSANYPNDIDYLTSTFGIQPPPIVSIDINSTTTTTTTVEPTTTTTTTTTPEPFICVSGCGTSSITGTYSYAEEGLGGRGVWVLNTGSESVSAYWSNLTNIWRIDGNIAYYYSYDNVSDPWLITNWKKFSGELPHPTISQGSCSP
jgi:hypothetical protein